MRRVKGKEEERDRQKEAERGREGVKKRQAYEASDATKKNKTQREEEQFAKFCSSFALRSLTCA